MQKRDFAAVWAKPAGRAWVDPKGKLKREDDGLNGKKGGRIRLLWKNMREYSILLLG
jgi:hypothetical protein